jgi:LytS/YehU family sensor histidine kinase
VPLRRELEYLRIYLSIQQVRFQDRLQISINADPESLAAAVPQMALQPIVENAIRHGIGPFPAPVELKSAPHSKMEA